MVNTTNPPKGVDLLAKLLDLLAEQEGVKIQYIIKEKERHEPHHHRTVRGGSRKT